MDRQMARGCGIIRCERIVQRAGAPFVLAIDGAGDAF
jgi:hypothetical protein